MSDISDRIARGDLSEGDALPTRVELAAQYDAARATVDKALTELSRRGLVESRSGKRTIVRPRGAENQEATIIGVLWNWPADQERQGADYLDLLFRGIREACAHYLLEVHFRAAPLNSWPELVQGKSAQGLLIVRPDYSDGLIVDGIHSAGVPVVLVPGDLDQKTATSVSSDNRAGVESAVDYLVSLGHRDIGFVSLTATVPDHFERVQGFLSTTATHRLNLRPEWMALAHERNPSLYREHLEGWLSTTSFPTAIISCDFMMTLSVLSRLRELGLGVPEDVSVVTFDDPLVAAQLHPPLTAISQNVPRLGFRAIEHLRELIGGRPAPKVDRIETQLIVRESTAKPSR